MKYYAHFGHHDFILCLGYRGDVIKNYFRTYDECASSDFVFSEGGRRLELLQSDIAEWRITFVDTGINSNIGDRKSTRLNSSHGYISYAVFCLKKKKKESDRLCSECMFR